MHSSVIINDIDKILYAFISNIFLRLIILYEIDNFIKLDWGI